MCASFDDVMLEVVMVEKQQAFFGSGFSKLTFPLPIPFVRLRQIVFAQSFPCFAFATASEGLFVERCAYFTVAAFYSLVVYSAQVVP